MKLCKDCESYQEWGESKLFICREGNVCANREVCKIQNYITGKETSIDFQLCSVQRSKGGKCTPQGIYFQEKETSKSIAAHVATSIEKATFIDYPTPTVIGDVWKKLDYSVRNRIVQEWIIIIEKALRKAAANA